MNASKKWPWPAVVALAIAGLLVLSQIVLPPTTAWWDAAFLAGAAACTTVIAVATARMRGSVQLIWWCFTGFVALSLIGDALYLLLGRLTDQTPFPGWPDVPYLASYGLAFAGLLLVGRRRHPGGGAAAWIDAGILTVAVAATVSVLSQVPQFSDLHVFDAGAVLTVAYPVIDLAMLAALLRVVLVGGGRKASSLLIVSAFAVIFSADLLFNVAYADDSSDVLTGISQALYLAAYVLLAVAALLPSARELGEPIATPTDDATTRRAVLLTFGVLVTPALMLSVIWPDDRWLERLLAVLTLIVILLALVRISLLLRVVERQAAALGREARTDPLTGLPNRRTLDFEVDRAVADARVTGAPLTLAMIDMDHFKAFNDDHGHLAGDDLLVSAVREWVRVLPPGAFLARYGGEEFTLLLPGCVGRDAVAVLERVRLATPSMCTASIGFAELGEDETGRAALRRADRGLYAAKSAGRNRVVAADVSTA